MIAIASGDHGGRDIDIVHARRVSELSDGKLQIRERPAATRSDVEDERRDRRRTSAAGRVAMAKVGARAWDAAGIDDFTPLVAPFAITSLEQQERVLRSAVAREMLESVAAARAAGHRAPARRAALPDRRHARRGAPGGLPRRGGGDPRVAIPPSGRSPRSADGRRRSPPDSGSTASTSSSRTCRRSPDADGPPRVRSVTANLPLWPRTQDVVMNQAAYDRLTGRAEAHPRRTRRGPRSARPGRAIVESGAAGQRRICTREASRCVVATPADAAAFRRAVAPVLAPRARERPDRARRSPRSRACAAATDTVSCAGRRSASCPPSTSRRSSTGPGRPTSRAAQYFAAEPEPGEADEANWGPLRMTLDHGRFAIENARFPGQATRGVVRRSAATGC